MGDYNKMLKKTALCIAAAYLLCAPARAADLNAIGTVIDMVGSKELGSLSGIDLEHALDYLDWEKLTVSLKADMTSINETLGKSAKIDSVIYKQGMSAIRIDVRGTLELNKKKKPLLLADCSVLRFPLKKTSYLLLPQKKRSMQLDPEKSRELLADLKQLQNNKKDATIHKKEKLGWEEIDGHQCEKMHIIMMTGKGIKNDITAWLARDLSGFPVKILLRSETPRGIEGTSTTLFTNIVKAEPDSELFAIPDDYKEYKTLLGLATGGKARR